MKKYLLVALVVISFAGCSDDSNEATSNNTNNEQLNKKVVITGYNSDLAHYRVQYKIIGTGGAIQTVQIKSNNYTTMDAIKLDDYYVDAKPNYISIYREDFGIIQNEGVQIGHYSLIINSMEVNQYSVTEYFTNNTLEIKVEKTDGKYSLTLD
jgi:hypothetical protein